MKKDDKKIETPTSLPLHKPGFFNWLWRKKWWLIFIGVVVVAGLTMFGESEKQKNNNYSTIAVTRGDLKQIVSATGEIKPVNTIAVGSQVSGIIEEIYVDYNDQVKKDQILLKIDQSVLQASVDESLASLDSAVAQRNYDKAEYERSQSLFSDGFIAKSELEQKATQYQTSEQSVKRMQSQYERALTNLGYATITSPVDGTVISRKVDKGQTVAASFQTPDLFEIAEDLSKMQIQTSVSEADIGVIKNGQSVTFTVDAYPADTFKGNVSQIRLSPTTTSNVVVYTVIIDVDNSDLRLMPGMTAFVTIVVNEKKDVWKASNSAFLVRSIKTLSNDPRVQSDEFTAKNTLVVQRGRDIILVPFSKGLTTATETEIVTTDPNVSLKENDKIITGIIGASSTSASTSRNNMHGGMGGGGDGPM